MFTITVGNTFLKEYNRRNQSDYSPKEFFEDEFFRIFFDHPKYLWWVQNSEFTQGLSSDKNNLLIFNEKLKNPQNKTLLLNTEEEVTNIEKQLLSNKDVRSFKKTKGKNGTSFKVYYFLDKKERQTCLTKFTSKINKGARDMSVIIGSPASEENEFATTSGMVTDLDTKLSLNDVYLSWIGGALIVGVSGGVGILFDDPEICYETFEGWKVYRKYLNDPVLERLRPNQIHSWNGQWLTFKLGRDYRSDFNFDSLKGKEIFKITSEKIEIETVPWTKLFFSLSNRFPNGEKLGNIFSLGQTNKTFGFFPFYLKSARRLVDIYQKLFTEESYALNTTQFESLFGKHIKRACELGAIGLQALEPKNLTKYFGKDSNLRLKEPNYSRKKNESDEDFSQRFNNLKEKDNLNLITFQTYKTWLIAMISKNKEELLEYTTNIAKALVKYREGARKLDRKNLLEKQLFATTKKRDFLTALNAIVTDSTVKDEIIQQVKELRDRAFLMNDEDFSYLALLLKFDYAYQERFSNN